MAPATPSHSNVHGQRCSGAIDSHGLSPMRNKWKPTLCPLLSHNARILSSLPFYRVPCSIFPLHQKGIPLQILCGRIMIAVIISANLSFANLKHISKICATYPLGSCKFLQDPSSCCVVTLNAIESMRKPQCRIANAHRLKPLKL